MRALPLLVLVVVVACSRRGGDSARSRAGTLSVEWSGKQGGSFTGAATARWCPADTLLEIIAVRGDTAVGLSLIAQDSVRPVAYVVNETRNFTPGRPQANVALRMLGDINLLGYDAMSGRVVVTQGGATVSGTLDVRLRPVSGTDSLQLKGSFLRIPVSVAAGVCGRANKPGGG